MTGNSPRSPDIHPAKRMRASSPDKDSPTSLPSGGGGAASPPGDHGPDGAGLGGHAAGKVGQSSNFRNVSACNRCRLRKNRCDQKLPSCATCEKAGVACVGYDPITKREIPRSYVFYLETRIEKLEALLHSNSIPFPSSENLEYCSRPGAESSIVRSPTEAVRSSRSDGLDAAGNGRPQNDGDDNNRLQKLVSKSGMAGVPEAANPRYLGSTTGISFARVVFAAVQSSVSDLKSSSDKNGIRPSNPVSGSAAAGATGTSMRDSFFGLHAKPTIHPATFPEKALGLKLVNLYFEHANPQIPVLHKVNFMQMFEQAYAEGDRVRGPKELYMLNMVFAIGGGIFMSDSAKSDAQGPRPAEVMAGTKQCQPEEYHASAIVHLEACLSNSGGGLEELQAVLLLANFALLRPVPPGLWYIIGVAVRLAVDLGLHYEDGKDIEAGLEETAATAERGRRQYVRDMRRRLWWCTYSFDRLVSVCVGRPFGISDQVITTEFPSLLEDRYITSSGFLETPPSLLEPTYKLVAHHYFRLRLLQSEILQVLQYQQAQIARVGGQNVQNPWMHKTLPSPFLSKFASFRSWRIDIDKRLWEWKNAAPDRRETGVAFSTDFLDLNYWQAIIMLYRQSLSVPAMFEGEYHTSKEMNSPTVFSMELREDEDRVYLKVAEAGQRILRLYRSLHVKGVVNYTYLATHNLFMAGISYLYAIWHSPIVRSRLTMDEVDFTILAATSVFTDLIDKCPPAETCRDAFDRTAKATVKMANSNGGFGKPVGGTRPSSVGSHDRRRDVSSVSDSTSSSGRTHTHPGRRSADLMMNPMYDPSLDAMSTGASSSSQISALQKPQFRLAGMSSVKSDPDGFSMMRKVPPQPRSNASSSDGPITPDASAIDPSLMPSPTMQQRRQQQPHHTPPSMQLNSPVTMSDGLPLNALQGAASTGATPTSTIAGFLGQQQPQPVFSPGGLGFGDLQGFDLSDFGNGGDAQMDLGLGLGWEGLHHDFSDGQQVDLFDGFFFGGQQNGMGASGAGGL